jgi:CRP-like cAMP-binding protein
MSEQLQLSFNSYKKDFYIVVEGKKADAFYIIQQGTVRITKDVVVEGEQNDTLGPGDFFGVISAMSGHSHIETAQALSDVVLITVSSQQYSGLIQKSPQVAVKIITQFSKRLRFLNKNLVQNTVKNTTENGFSQLFNVAEYYYGQKQFDQAAYVYKTYLKCDPSGENAATAKEHLAELQKAGAGIEGETAPEKAIRTYRKDAMLFAEGEPGDELFIIQSGSIKITKIIANSEVLLATLKAGDILGEMALLEDQPRGASAIAYENCTVMVVGRANFKQMIVSHPQIIIKVTTVLAERIWFIYKQLANTMLDDPIAKMYDTLYIQLEKNKVEIDDMIPHTFDFGQAELAKMVGLSSKDAAPILEKLMENKSIRILEGKLFTTSTSEIAKQTDFYRRMDKRKKNLEENRK